MSKESDAKYYAKNSMRIKDRTKKYRIKNSDTIKAKDRARYCGERKEKRKTYNVSYYKSHPFMNVKQIYGITADEYVSMFNSQGGKCKICKKDFPYLKGRMVHIDHNHNTGKVRGLLCSGCNIALGGARDNWKILLFASRYIIEENKK